jgi:hypothetical protein
MIPNVDESLPLAADDAGTAKPDGLVLRPQVVVADLAVAVVAAAAAFALAQGTTGSTGLAGQLRACVR